MLFCFGFTLNLSADRYQHDEFMGSVYFSLSSAEISTASRKDVLKMVSLFAQAKYSNYQLHLIGFADNTGDARENMALGLKRAENVALLLKKELGIQDYAITTSWGDRSARYSARDRRVDIYLDRPLSLGEFGTAPMLVVMFLITMLIAAVVIFGRRSRSY